MKDYKELYELAKNTRDGYENLYLEETKAHTETIKELNMTLKEINNLKKELSEKDTEIDIVIMENSSLKDEIAELKRRLKGGK